MKTTRSLEDIINQCTWLTKEQKEAFYRAFTGLTEDKADIIFDGNDIKCVRLIDSIVSLSLDLNVVPIIGKIKSLEVPLVNPENSKD